jgi:hypothetical protein
MICMPVRVKREEEEITHIDREREKENERKSD